MISVDGNPPEAPSMTSTPLELAAWDARINSGRAQLTYDSAVGPVTAIRNTEIRPATASLTLSTLLLYPQVGLRVFAPVRGL
jgi:hypothetical protein